MKPFKALLLNVERELTSRGWEQKDLASKIEMSPAQLSRCLKGYSSPSLETLERIAKGFEITVSALLRAPDETTDHDIRECHARIGRSLDEWQKLVHRLGQVASQTGDKKKS